jgi:hypothetical protein
MSKISLRKQILLVLLFLMAPTLSIFPEAITLYRISTAGGSTIGIVVEEAVTNGTNQSHTALYKYVVNGVDYHGGGKTGFVHHTAADLVLGEQLPISYLRANPQIARTGDSNAIKQRLHGDILSLLAIYSLTAVFVYWRIKRQRL